MSESTETLKKKVERITREIEENLRALTRHIPVEEYLKEKAEVKAKVKKKQPQRQRKVIKAAPVQPVVDEGDLDEILERERKLKVMRKAAGDILPRRSPYLSDEEYLKRLELRSLFRSVMVISDIRQRINRLAGIYTDFSPVKLRAIQALGGELKRLERQADRELLRMLEGMPIWKEWMRDVRGVGPRLAAGFVSEIFDIGRFATISKLWAYCGMHVVNGRAPRKMKGQQANWNSRLRRLLFNLTDCFMKSKGFYRREYERCRAKEDSLYPDLSASHRQMRARRRVAKLFLAHLWTKWRQLERLPVEKPWIVEYGGHKHYISPDDAVERQR